VIQLEINTASNRPFTLWELMTDKSNPVMFKVTNPQSGAVYYFKSPELSPFVKSYNLVRIMPKNAEPINNLNGEFLAITTGTWHYVVYEMSADTFNLNDIVRTLEVGMIYIMVDPTQGVAYDKTETATVYEGNV
jgi:hypothetical protein